MISSTSEYALRALVTLAEATEGTTMQARALARATGVSPSYLYKVLTTLRRTGILEGARGSRGGYSLARPPEEICLVEVVSLFEVVRSKDACLLGRSEGCSDDMPCGAHEDWKRVRGAFEEFLKSKTVADLTLVERPSPEPE
jgi:Rrf2 family protein